MPDTKTPAQPAEGPYTARRLFGEPEMFVLDSDGRAIAEVFAPQEGRQEDTARLLAASWELREALGGLLVEMEEKAPDLLNLLSPSGPAFALLNRIEHGEG